MDLVNKEEELQDFYEEDVKKEKKKKGLKVGKKRIILGIFTFIIFISLLDLLLVYFFDKGPYFMIPLKTYPDGGTKEYYGLGYKIIKYHQVQGRRDREIGFWNLKYYTTPLDVQDIDLAIDLEDNMINVYSTYYGKFIRLSSTLLKIDLENYELTLGYVDEGGKYSFDILCQMVREQDISSFEVGKDITVIGTFKKVGNSKKVVFTNCFAEQ